MEAFDKAAATAIRCSLFAIRQIDDGEGKKSRAFFMVDAKSNISALISGEERMAKSEQRFFSR